jgi:hypothetical protein
MRDWKQLLSARLDALKLLHGRLKSSKNSPSISKIARPT